MSAPGTNERNERSPAWGDAVELVGTVGTTVLYGVCGDLADRRVRWALTTVQVAAGVGTAMLRLRYPRPRSADMRLVSAVMTDARDRGDLDLTRLRQDPAVRATQDRLNRRTARMVIFGVSVLVGRRLLPAELRRRGVRRPHLVTGIVLATAQGAYRVGTLLAARVGQHTEDDRSAGWSK